mgnify:FL=1
MITSVVESGFKVFRCLLLACLAADEIDETLITWEEYQ